MTEIMLKMAKRAVQDSSLFASLIQEYGRSSQKSWAQVAADLNIDEAQLAKLALCQRPRRQQFLQDIAHTATYVDMSSASLSDFVRRVNQVEYEAVVEKKRPFFKKWEVKPMFKRRAIAFSFVALIILFFATFAFAQTGSNGSEATLVVTSGSAIVQQTDAMFLAIPLNTSSASVDVATGDVLTVSEGDIISLAKGSTAQLRLYDGGTVDLFDDAVVEVSELVTNEQTYRVQLNLLAGRAFNRVVKLLGADDSYKMQTPSSTASVRGTVFNVEVISTNESYVAVFEGLVNVKMGDQDVNVAPGEEVTAVVGQPLTVQLQNGETEEPPAPTPTQVPERPDEPEENVTVCHIPPGNPDNFENIMVGASAVAAHLAHGDSLGDCPTPTPTVPEVESSTPEEDLTVCHNVPPGNPVRAIELTIGAPAVRAHLQHGDTLGTCPTITPTPDDSGITATQTPTATATIDSESGGIPGEAQETICHIPAGNPENSQTITIGASAVPAHLDHGDTLGACPADSNSGSENNNGNNGNSGNNGNPGNNGNSGNNNGKND